MATISFYGTFEGTQNQTIIDQTVSGVGFFGGGFGLSVPVDSYQTTSYVTNSDGSIEGSKLQNTKYASASGVEHNGAAEVDNDTIPNYYAPLQIRFDHPEAVRVQNCQLRIFDRNDITNHASGVTTQVYEVRHPETVAGANKALDYRYPNTGSDQGWQEFMYDGVTNEVSPMDLTWSPGISGLNGNTTDQANGNLTLTYSFDSQGHQSLIHDWYVSLSASPESIGSKTNFGLYFTLEYL